MPELPDILLTKKYFDHHCIGKEILEIQVIAPKVLFETTEQKLNKDFKGKKFKVSSQHGKCLYIPTSGMQSLSMHFGMTGELIFVDELSKNPSYTCVIFSLNKGFLVYTDRRRLGRIGIVKDLQELIKVHKQGPDAMTIEFKDFYETLRKKKGKIKPALMDQSLISGFGNVYTDEILFQSKIHPESGMAILDEKQYKTIYKNIAPIINESVKLDGVRENFSTAKYLISNREENAKCPRNDGLIKMKTIGGRSTFFCETCQKLYV